MNSFYIYILMMENESMGFIMLAMVIGVLLVNIIKNIFFKLVKQLYNKIKRTKAIADIEN
jgi:hypothetical protein